MSNVSTFGTFTMARLGIYASQKAIDIVGNNISNINTEGYTRQSIDQFSLNMGGADRYHSMMDTRVGSGAFVAGVTQERDQYLDIRYRSELASVGAMDAKVNTLSQLKSVLDEVGRGKDGEGVLEARFNEMIQMMQELNSKGAGLDEFDTLFRSAATSVVNTFHDYSNALEELAKNQALGFKDDIDDINTTLTRIRELNTNIRKTQIYGGNALEQQDERNLLLDKLSQYMRLSITTEKEYLGEKLYVDKLVIKTVDEPQRTLVDGIFATQLSIRGQVYAEDTTDLDGTVHKAGDPILDEKGVPLLDPDYNLDLSQLKDINGRVLTAKTDSKPATLVQETGDSPETIKLPVDALADAIKNNPTLYQENNADETERYVYRLKKNEDGSYVTEESEVEGVVQKNYIAEQYKITKEARTVGKPKTVAETPKEVTSNEKLAAYVLERQTAEDKDFPAKNEKTGNSYVYSLSSDGKSIIRTEQTYVEVESLVENFSQKVSADGVDDAATLFADTMKYPASGIEDGAKYTYTYALETDEYGDPVTAEDGTHSYIRTRTFTGEVELFDTELYGGLQAKRETLTKAGVFSTAEELAADPSASIKRGIPFYQKALDVMANTFANLLNNANLAAGGDSRPLFSNDGTKDTWGKTTDAGDEPITASNIDISKSWANGSLRVETTAGDKTSQSTASDNLSKVLMLLTTPQEFTPQGGANLGLGTGADGKLTYLGGDGNINQDADSKEVFFTGKFQQLFTNHMCGSLASDINIANTMLGNYEVMADELYVDRDAVMGVDLNDEAMNLMTYQKSFEAACRLMTTYDEMLDKLINGT